MKLSTRSRYGTRMMVDLAQHDRNGPVQIGEIAKREDISVKYLEQLVIPLKKSGLIRSVRGAKGGHLLARDPRDITMGDIVRVLEGGGGLAVCVDDPRVCERSGRCPTRELWREASSAMYKSLDAMTLAGMVARGPDGKGGRFESGRPGRASGQVH